MTSRIDPTPVGSSRPNIQLSVVDGTTWDPASLLERIAPLDIDLLILGETGTGKEIFAWQVARHSGREGPFVPVNCGALTDSLMESTLFGHEKGAFTGAMEERKGLFEAASGGTLFLDEVGELSLSAQASLLRVLETRRISRLGSFEEISTNVRVIAATNRDLDKMVENGEFREDLLFRINTMTIELPPLRERRSEIPGLVESFIREGRQRWGLRVDGVSDVAMTILMSYAWPGNIRELRNAVMRAVVVGGRILEPSDLPARIINATEVLSRPSSPRGTVEARPVVIEPLRPYLKRVEKEHLIRALEYCRGDRVRAAEVLGIPYRTLTYKLRSLSVGK